MAYDDEFEPSNAVKDMRNGTGETVAGAPPMGTDDQNAAIDAANKAGGVWTGDAPQDGTDSNDEIGNGNMLGGVAPGNVSADVVNRVPGVVGGDLTVLGGIMTVGSGINTPYYRVEYATHGGGGGFIAQSVNDPWSPQDPTKPSWSINFGSGAAISRLEVMHRAANAPPAQAGGGNDRFYIQPDGRATVFADPIDPMDVATKQYVDAVLAAARGS